MSISPEQQTTTNSLLSIKERLDDIGKSIETAKKLRDHTRWDVQNAQKNLDEQKIEVAKLAEAVNVVTEAVKQTQANLEVHVSPIINQALAGVFDKNYVFALKFGTRGKDTKTSEVGFEVISDGVVLDGKLTNQLSGGEVNLVAFGLKAAFLAISKNISKLLMLDECLVNLRGNDYQEKAAILQKNISERLGVQIVLISHDRPLQSIADKVVDLSQPR